MDYTIDHALDHFVREHGLLVSIVAGFANSGFWPSASSPVRSVAARPAAPPGPVAASDGGRPRRSRRSD